MPTTARHTALPAPTGDGAAPPEWIHLLPAGEFRGVDGRGPYRLDQPDAVIAASLPPGGGAKLVVDENHATDLTLATGQPAPARGWITALAARADGVWGQVDWTGAGAELVTRREYGGISPVFDYAADGRVLRVRRAALTNLPNLAALTLRRGGDAVRDARPGRGARGRGRTAGVRHPREPVGSRHDRPDRPR